MEIRKVDFSIEDRIANCQYLGSGASKVAYYDKEKNVVIKVPLGRECIPRGATYRLLNNIKELADELSYIYFEMSVRLVWSIGQFLTELLVWESVCAADRKGIEGKELFAAITDYYVDRDGVIVIEQESAPEVVDQYEASELIDMLDEMKDYLEMHDNIVLRDINGFNMGKNSKGEVKLFDFGLGSDDLYKYDCYSDYDYEYNNYEEEEDFCY